MSYFASNLISTVGRIVVNQITQNSRRQLQPTPFYRANDSFQTTAIPNPWSFNQVREAVTFKPGENKRIKKLGWYKKLSTRHGRLQIMRRILKGRFVLTH